MVAALDNAEFPYETLLFGERVNTSTRCDPLMPSSLMCTTWSPDYFRPTVDGPVNPKLFCGSDLLDKDLETLSEVDGLLKAESRVSNGFQTKSSYVDGVK